MALTQVLKPSRFASNQGFLLLHKTSLLIGICSYKPPTYLNLTVVEWHGVSLQNRGHSLVATYKSCHHFRDGLF